MSYEQAFIFNLVLYTAQLTFFTLGSMAFLKYLSKRDR